VCDRLQALDHLVSLPFLISYSIICHKSYSITRFRKVSIWPFSEMKIRLIIKAMIAPLPSGVKVLVYRHVFGYKIGKHVSIGLSVIDTLECVIDDDVCIGHFNLLVGTKKLQIGDHAKIGHLNIIRGGDEVRLGRYSEIIRLNEINSIPDPDVLDEIDPRFILGDGSVVVASHKIDFTDRVEFGRRVILGGRNSSLWTHNRQMTKPITIGDYAYVGSEIRIAPGGEIPPRCVVGIGSVITKKLEGENNLIAGVPAKVVNALGEEGRFLTEYKTRKDLPDEI
jgi:acetyltransferase-like isoleucine patch superfamily enzyme